MKLKVTATIVTGASEGLGLEIATLYAAEGANVAICGRRSDALASAREKILGTAAPGVNVLAHSCDVSHASEVRQFVAQAIDAFGSVQVLVNNAGVYGPKGASESVDLKEWMRAIEINLYGVYIPCREAITHFKAHHFGKIINLSGGGATAPMPFISAYAASKAAVVRLTETLAEELREFHIDVNAVAPGALNTRLLDEVLIAGPSVVGDRFYDRAIKQKEAGGASIEVAAQLCVWLASRESDGITGRLISAQWDPWQRLGERRENLSNSDIYTLRRIVPKDRGESWD